MRERGFHPESVRSILVIRLYFLGDMLLSTPVLDALRHGFPEARISVLLKKRARELLAGNPNVDEVIEYDAVERYHNPRWLLGLGTALRRRRFDLAVDLTGDRRSSFLLWLADPAFRVGFNHCGCGFLLDRSIPYRSEGLVVDHLLSVVEPLGARAEERAPRLYLSEEETARAREILRSRGLGDEERYVVLSPGASWEYKRWPAERFAELATSVRGRLGFRCVVTGGEADRGIAGEIAERSEGAAVDLAGATTIREFAGVAAGAAAFVGNDSGPMHVAAAVRTPVVGLFGPSTPERFAPQGAPSRIVWHRYPCSPCSERRCVKPSDPCMEAVTVEEVSSALESLIREEVPTA